MAKFGGTQTAPRSPVVSQDPTWNQEGSPSWTLDAKGEFFLLAATHMVDATFYETATARDKRFTGLIHQLVGDGDSEWLQGFASYLRSELKMRSASVLLACEYVRAGGPEGRRMVDAVCQRPDEPGEVLACWTARFGRKFPKAIKRGVADAARRLYTQRSVIKWDSSRVAFPFADVIELTHPTPGSVAQSTLFKYLLDQAHNGDGWTQAGSRLDAIVEIERDHSALAVPEEARRKYLRAGQLPHTWSWERLAGWLPGGMDAEAWEAVIPSMGVMALIRNLRNFDAAGISESAIDTVITKITDPFAVKQARIFPYQVWTAYREAPSDNWKRALGKTLDATCDNVPVLDGKTLVVVDCSYSMTWALSGRSKVARMELAASMGAALAVANQSDIVVFAGRNELIPFQRGISALNLTRQLHTYLDDGHRGGKVGGGTYLHTALRENFDPERHQRVIVFTDDEAHDTALDVSFIPRLYTFDLAGTATTSQKNGTRGRFVFGGYSDATMTGISALEAVGHTGWPWAS